VSATPSQALSLEAELSPFWRWQIFGWLAYGTAMFIAAAQELPLEQALINKSANTAIGVGLSLTLRAIYRRFRSIPLTLAGCVAGGALWSVMANSLFWVYLGIDLAGIAPAQFFNWTLLHCLALLAWCALYIGVQRYDEAQQAHALALAARATPGSSPLVVRADGELKRLPQAEIHCIEAARNYSCIVCSDGTHVVRQPLSALEARLDAGRFVRAHRSTLVAADRIRSLRVLPTQDAVATLQNGYEIRVSRACREQVERAMRATR
jgi:hypothetical protein